MSKEYIDIFSIVKDIASKDDFTINLYDESTYTKESLQKLLLGNNKIVTIIEQMKVKNKLSRLNNKNLLNILKNFKTHEVENKLVINNLSLFSLLYNEPKHIERLNFSLYTKITENVIIMSKDIRLVSLING
jgi:hypothetical protein